MSRGITTLRKYLELKENEKRVLAALESLKPKVRGILAKAPRREVEVDQKILQLNDGQNESISVAEALEKLGELVKPLVRVTPYLKISILDVKKKEKP